MITKRRVNEKMLTKEDQLRMKLTLSATHVRTDNPLYLAEQTMANTAPGTFDVERVIRVARCDEP